MSKISYTVTLQIVIKNCSNTMKEINSKLVKQEVTEVEKQYIIETLLQPNIKKTDNTVRL